MVKLAVTGAGGRMGRRIIALASQGQIFKLTAALEAPGSSTIGQDAGILAGIGAQQLSVTKEITEKPDVVIDFSTPTSTEKWLTYCRQEKVPLVIGTTGLSEEFRQTMAETAKKIPLLWAANMSLGINLLLKFTAQMAGILPPGYDIEIIETHHRSKRDAPSGTAMELSRYAAESKQWPWPDCLVHGRDGKDELRQEKTIGMHAVRGGDVVGEHTVTFAGLGETIELRHRAHSRDTLARGALQAAAWLMDQKPGLYNMFDVLGIT